MTVTREFGGYRFRDGNLNPLHTSSVPKNDDEAIAYISQIEKWLPGNKVQYIERRELGKGEYALMDIQIENGKVVPL